MSQERLPPDKVLDYLYHPNIFEFKNLLFLKFDSPVFPGWYIGDKYHAKDKTALQTLGITRTNLQFIEKYGFHAFGGCHRELHRAAWKRGYSKLL